MRRKKCSGPSKRVIILICLFLVWSQQKIFANSCPIPESMTEEARSFALSKGLFSTADEEVLAGISSRIRVTSVKSHKGYCILHLKACWILDPSSPTKVDCATDTRQDVIVWQKDRGFSIFEETFEIPQTLRVGVGNPTRGFLSDGSQAKELEARLYFSELKGPSVIAALKEVFGGFSTYGFSGYVIPKGKTDFDPTVGRSWQIVDANYDLNRGSTGEANDINPAHWDLNFDAAFKGAVKHSIVVGDKKVIAAKVAPWSSASLRSVQASDASWIQLFTKEGQRLDLGTLDLGFGPKFQPCLLEHP